MHLLIIWLLRWIIDWPFLPSNIYQTINSFRNCIIRNDSQMKTIINERVNFTKFRTSVERTLRFVNIHCAFLAFFFGSLAMFYTMKQIQSNRTCSPVKITVEKPLTLHAVCKNQWRKKRIEMLLWNARFYNFASFETWINRSNQISGSDYYFWVQQIQ